MAPQFLQITRFGSSLSLVAFLLPDLIVENFLFGSGVIISSYYTPQRALFQYIALNNFLYYQSMTAALIITIGIRMSSAQLTSPDTGGFGWFAPVIGD